MTLALQQNKYKKPENYLKLCDASNLNLYSSSTITSFLNSSSNNIITTSNNNLNSSVNYIKPPATATSNKTIRFNSSYKSLNKMSHLSNLFDLVIKQNNNRRLKKIESNHPLINGSSSSSNLLMSDHNETNKYLNLKNKFLTDSFGYGTRTLSGKSTSSILKPILSTNASGKLQTKSNLTSVSTNSLNVLAQTESPATDYRLRMKTARNRVNIANHFKLPRKVAPLSASYESHELATSYSKQTNTHNLFERFETVALSLKKKDKI